MQDHGAKEAAVSNNGAVPSVVAHAGDNVITTHSKKGQAKVVKSKKNG
jgi:hypothetical protein